jgi:DNA-binding transcriptional MocR family regulator
MKLSKEQHLEHVLRLTHPDQKAKYYKMNVDPTVVNLSTAKNVLLLKYLQRNVFVDLGIIDQETIAYPIYIYGGPEYREGVRQFICHQLNVSLSADNIFAVSGVVAGLEILALALFKPGDEVLIPAPLRYGFPWSFSQTAGMKFVPFPIDGGVSLTRANVESALGRFCTKFR